MLLRRDTLEVARTVECDPGVSVVRVVWHSKINQVSLRIRDINNSEVRVIHKETKKLTVLREHVDRYGTVEWADQSDVFIECVVERCKTTAPKVGQKSDDRRRIAAVPPSAYYHPARAADVSGGEPDGCVQWTVG